MLKRRALIGGVAAAPFLSTGEARATTLAEFVVHHGVGGAAEGTPTGGMRLRGGRYDDFRSGVRLFSRATVPGAGTVRYRLTRETIPPVVTANGVWFNVGIVWGRDPARLPATSPTGDEAVAPLWNGWRITHANHDPPTVPTSNRVRLRTYPGRVAVPQRGRKVTADFRLGVTYDVVLTWSGTNVSLAVPAMGVSQSFAAPALAVPRAGARLMFYASYGGQYLIEDVRLA